MRALKGPANAESRSTSTGGPRAARPLAAYLLGAAAILALAPGCTCDSAPAAPPPPPPREEVARGVTLAVFARGLDEPVALAFAPGDPPDRLFVVEKPGRVRILRNGTARAEPFLDIHELVSGASEQGLLGLAFHPKYSQNGRFFVNYTDVKGDTRIVEYRVSAGDPDRADPASARELLFVDQPYSNHNGGHLVFGPDGNGNGKLWIGLGDGGSRDDPKGNSQNPQSLLGKMLVLDVDATQGAERPAPRIVQTGLRNPWRYSFDRKTGDLYIADVGQDRWEEIHVVPAGGLEGHNFGWNRVEGNGHCLRGGGPCPQDGMTPPVLEYGHGEGCSITGGFVYRGEALPELDGVYFYTDYCTALLRSFRWKDGRATEATDWKAILDPKSALSKPSSFGEDARGELYVLSQDGVIYALARKR